MKSQSNGFQEQRVLITSLLHDCGVFVLVFQIANSRLGNLPVFWPLGPTSIGETVSACFPEYRIHFVFKKCFQENHGFAKSTCKRTFESLTIRRRHRPLKLPQLTSTIQMVAMKHEMKHLSESPVSQSCWCQGFLYSI